MRRVVPFFTRCLRIARSWRNDPIIPYPPPPPPRPPLGGTAPRSPSAVVRVRTRDGQRADLPVRRGRRVLLPVVPGPEGAPDRAERTGRDAGHHPEPEDPRT